ncbi:hypothetical protein FISHEDRAFT_78724 [Fistulina hepatica ATCC 64428]|uniref:Uncharacterized protein n=1 Tax=Fistulina hepatica ATCC 64428 TaxID=1128425 RepID=A0A0D7A2P6_9AGAR|nr:hypothetical protein FISHEDRAFT_78724 [Fistulina hepatica ATCC 64428]
MPSALEILEKKIARITTQIESMDKGGGKKRKWVWEESPVVAPKKKSKKVARESSPIVLTWREKHVAMLADDTKWEPVKRGGDCKWCVKLYIECEKRILGVAVACRACLQLKVGCSQMGGRGKKKVLVEEAPPDDEYEESSEESGSGSGESGESREDKEDEGEVQGPQEDPELVGRMKELGESFERVREEMGDELKGMEKDVKMVRTEVMRLFKASGDREAGLGEAQSRISMGDLLGQVERPKFQMWAAGFPNAIRWSVVQNMVTGVSAA